MIQAHGLTKDFDGFVAVNGLTLSVSAGEILALLGPNGAGKTTTVRMLAAILRPTEGGAKVAGYDVLADPSGVRQSVGLLTEDPGLYHRMRGREYLTFFGRVYGLDDETIRDRSHRLLESFGMLEAQDRRMGEYSKGMRQKMALTRAMLHDPRVLLLDEPTSAMDPHSAKLVRDAILSLRDQHRAFLVCTHNLAEAEILADRIAIIRAGEIVALGTPRELKQALLGPPIMELCLNGSSRDAPQVVERFARVLDSDEGRVLYETETPQATNPQIVRALTKAGDEVVTLSEVEQSLEAVYLQAVGEA